MKRTEYVAEAADQMKITFAFNSGIRATEAIVRGIARSEKQSYEGGKTSRVDNVYRRTWTGKRTGRVIEVSVKENDELSKPQRIHCDSCAALMIQGLFCHETGCPNTNSRYDAETGSWVKQRKCFECGYTVDRDDPCCSAKDDD